MSSSRRERTHFTPVARHARLTSPRPVTQILTAMLAVVGVVVLTVVGVGAFMAYDLGSDFADGAVDLTDQPAAPPDIGAIEGGVNVLIAGTDTCEPEYAHFFGDRCTGDASEATLNDVNMLVHISDEPRRVTVVSFPRDLLVPIAECTNDEGYATGGYTDMLNAAYMNGGLGCVVSTVSQLSGQAIPYAAEVTWGGVIEITNAIGGVDVCIANGIKDPYTGIDWPEGTRNVQGLDALQFLRTRYGVGDGGDLGRISNQQQYLSRLTKKIMSEEVLTNPATLYNLASTGVNNVNPSTSLTNPWTVFQIAMAVKDVPLEEIVFLQYPVFPSPDDPNRVVPDYDSAEALWAAIDANVPLKVTGDVGEGVVAAPGTETEAPVAPEDGGEGKPDAGGDAGTATPAPTETPLPGGAIALPETITGSTAFDETCSYGNVRG